jgi:hypothetical protein
MSRIQLAVTCLQELEYPVVAEVNMFNQLDMVSRCCLSMPSERRARQLRASGEHDVPRRTIASERARRAHRAGAMRCVEGEGRGTAGQGDIKYTKQREVLEESDNWRLATIIIGLIATGIAIDR